MSLPDRFIEAAREREAQATRLREEHLDSDVPADVAADLFSYAYDQGHAHGWHDVEGHYADLAPIVNRAFQSGWSAAR